MTHTEVEEEQVHLAAAIKCLLRMMRGGSPIVSRTTVHKSILYKKVWWISNLYRVDIDPFQSSDLWEGEIKKISICSEDAVVNICSNCDNGSVSYHLSQRRAQWADQPHLFLSSDTSETTPNLDPGAAGRTEGTAGRGPLSRRGDDDPPGLCLLQTARLKSEEIHDSLMSLIHQHGQYYGNWVLVRKLKLILVCRGEEKGDQVALARLERRRRSAGTVSHHVCVPSQSAVCWKVFSRLRPNVITSGNTNPDVPHNYILTV